MKMEIPSAAVALTAAAGALFGGAAFRTVSGALSSSLGALAFTSKYTPTQKIVSALAFTALNLATTRFLVEQPIVATCVGLLPILALRPYAAIGIGLTTGTGLVGSYALSKLSEIVSRKIDPVLLTLLGIEVIGSAITGACLPSLLSKDEDSMKTAYKFTAYTAASVAGFATFLHIISTTSNPLFHAGILFIPAGLGAAIRTRSIFAAKPAPDYKDQLAEFRRQAALKHKAASKGTTRELDDAAEEIKDGLAQLRKIKDDLETIKV